MEYNYGNKTGVWKMYNEQGELVNQKDYSKTE
jgi:antitoxin component YwqK of YwqJK toxin-antitoxin module